MSMLLKLKIDEQHYGFESGNAMKSTIRRDCAALSHTCRFRHFLRREDSVHGAHFTESAGEEGCVDIPFQTLRISFDVATASYLSYCDWIKKTNLATLKSSFKARSG